MKKIYTDGACSQNSSWKGGWGFLVLDENNEIILKKNGAEEMTTNSRMEILAVVEALKSVDDKEITIVSDSIYVCNTLNEWLDSWISKGILETKAHADLWREIAELRKGRTIIAQHVRGHNGDYFNEIADRLATGAVKGRLV